MPNKGLLVTARGGGSEISCGHVDITAFLPTDYKSTETAAPKVANLLLF